MSLQKGFLRDPELKISGWLLFAGLLLALVISFSFYGIFLITAEVFRSSLVDFQRSMLILSPDDIRYYSYAIALMASVIGQGFGLKLILENTGRAREFRQRFATRVFQHQVSLTQWYFLHWTLKWLSVMTIVFVTFQVYFAMNLRSELGYLFFLLPFTWFLNYWLGAYKVFRKRYFRTLSLGFLQLALSTFIIANIKVVNHEAVNEFSYNSFPENQYQMELPETFTRQHIRRHHIHIKLYLMAQGEQTKSYFETIDDTPKALNDSSLDSQIITQYKEISTYDKFNAKFLIVADARVPLSDVLKVEKKARQVGMNEVHFRTTGKYSIYPWYYPYFQNSAFSKRLPNDCEGVKQTVDSLKSLGYRAAQIRWPELPCYDVALALKDNRVLIRRSKKGFFLNEKPLTPHRLAQTLTKLQRQKPGTAMLYLPEADLSFEEYLEGRDVLKQAVINNRIRMADEQWDYEYDYHFEREWYRYGEKGDAYRRMRQTYPMNIIELTGWNLEFYQFLKE